LQELGSLIPAERQTSGSIIEVVPEGRSSPTHWASRCGRCATRPPLGDACR
jgi:hypothetical protein